MREEHGRGTRRVWTRSCKYCTFVKSKQENNMRAEKQAADHEKEFGFYPFQMGSHGRILIGSDIIKLAVWKFFSNSLREDKLEGDYLAGGTRQLGSNYDQRKKCEKELNK